MGKDNEVQASMLRVEGIVQRVGFRRFVEQAARQLKLSGFVENLKDGSVRVFVQGENSQIQDMISRLRSAPSPIVVEAVKSSPAQVRRSLKFFGIKSGPLALELQEGFGAMESQFGDYREEFRDYRNEFRDYKKDFNEFAVRTQENFNSSRDKVRRDIREADSDS